MDSHSCYNVALLAATFPPRYHGRLYFLGGVGDFANLGGVGDFMPRDGVGVGDLGTGVEAGVEAGVGLFTDGVGVLGAGAGDFGGTGVAAGVTAGVTAGVLG